MLSAVLLKRLLLDQGFYQALTSREKDKWSRKRLVQWEVQRISQAQTSPLFMILLHTHTHTHTHTSHCSSSLVYTLFDVASFNRHLHSHLPPAECYFCVLLLFMSQPFHSVDPQPVVRLAVLTGTICSPSQSLSHTHTHTHARSYKHRYYTHTHTQTRTHRPAACYMVPARGRLLHLSLSNLNPLAQQQLAPISSPLGLGFIKGTVMDTAACSRLTSSSHHWQVTVRSNGMWLSGQRNVLRCGADKPLRLLLISWPLNPVCTCSYVSYKTITTIESHSTKSDPIIQLWIFKK